MTRPSVEQLMPEWVKQEPHQVFPSIEAVVLTEKSLVVTADGLQTYPDAFTSAEAFSNHARNAFSYASLIKSPFLRVPYRHPEMLIKWDVARGVHLTLLTLAHLGETLPRETDEYVFQPIRLFWAAQLTGPTHLLAMENVEVKPVVYQPEHRALVKAMNRLEKEAGKLNLSTGRNLQDILYRGIDPLGRPIISVIDQTDPRIFELLEQTN